MSGKNPAEYGALIKEKSMIAKGFPVLNAILLSVCLGLSADALAWTSTADFESGVTGARAQGASGFSYSGTGTTFSADKAALGAKSAKMAWVAHSDGWDVDSGFPVFDKTVPLSEGQEIWARGYFYFASPWSFTATPVVKVMRIHVANASGGNVGWHSIEAGGVLNGDNGTLNANRLGYILSSNEPISRQASTGEMFDIDRWQCMEIYVKLSTTTPVTRIWKDGKLIYENKSDKTLSSSTDYANSVVVMSYWNGGAPQNQIEYVDDIIVTTDTPHSKDSAGNAMIGPALTPPLGVTAKGKL